MLNSFKKNINRNLDKNTQSLIIYFHNFEILIFNFNQVNSYF